MDKTTKKWLLAGFLSFAMMFGLMLGFNTQNNKVQVAYATDPENVAASELQIVLHRNDHTTDSTTFAGGKYLHINPAYETLETNSSSAGADMEYDASTGVLKLYYTDNMSTYEGDISLYGLNTSDKQLTIEDYYNGFDFYILAFEKGNLTLENVSNSESHITMGWGNKFKINGELTIRGNTKIQPWLSATGYNYDVNNIIEAGTLKLLGNSSLYYNANSSDDIYSIVYVNSLVLNTDGVLCLDSNTETDIQKVLYTNDVTLTKVKEIILVSPDNYDTTLTNSTYLRNAPISPIPGYYSAIIQEAEYGDYIKTYYLVSDSLHFTVLFYENGGTGTMASAYDVNGTFVLPECTFAPPTGYGDLEFQYWSDRLSWGNTYAEGASYTLVKDITFYALWKTATNHTVSFNANGGTGSMTGGSYLGAYTLPACTITAPSGKQFKCWALGSASGTQFNAGDTYYLHGASNITFYAVWEDIPNQTYTIFFNKTDPNAGGTMSNVEHQSSPYTLPDCSFSAPAGWHFKAWAKDSPMGAQYNPGNQVAISRNTTFYAIWEEDGVDTYTVTFLVGDGGTGATQQVNGISGNYTLPNNDYFTPQGGHRFKCWRVGGVDKNPGSQIQVNANVEVTAIWEVVYEVQFLQNGGGTGIMDNIITTGALTLPQCTFVANTNLKFKDWIYNGNHYTVGTQIVVTQNTQITAYWVKVIEEEIVEEDDAKVGINLKNAFTDARAEQQGLEIKIGSTSITFNASAVSQIGDSLQPIQFAFEKQEDGLGKYDISGAQFALNISLQGATFNANDGLVTIVVPIDNLVAEKGTVKVYFVDNEGNKTDMGAVYTNGKITFTTNHFSTYVVAVEGLDNGGVSVGAIIAIILGVIVLIGGAFFAYYWFAIRKKQQMKK